jgi:hypothetical protein
MYLLRNPYSERKFIYRKESLKLCAIKNTTKFNARLNMEIIPTDKICTAIRIKT